MTGAILGDDRGKPCGTWPRQQHARALLLFWITDEAREANAQLANHLQNVVHVLYAMRHVA